MGSMLSQPDVFPSTALMTTHLLLVSICSSTVSSFLWSCSIQCFFSFAWAFKTTALCSSTENFSSLLMEHTIFVLSSIDAEWKCWADSTGSQIHSPPLCVGREISFSCSEMLLLNTVGPSFFLKVSCNGLKPHCSLGLYLLQVGPFKFNGRTYFDLK